MAAVRDIEIDLHNGQKLIALTVNPNTLTPPQTVQRAFEDYITGEYPSWTYTPTVIPCDASSMSAIMWKYLALMANYLITSVTTYNDDGTETTWWTITQP